MRPEIYLDRYTPYSIVEIIDDLKQQIPDGAAFDISKVKIEIECDNDENYSKAFYSECETITYVDKNYKKKYKKYLEKLERYKNDLVDYKLKLNQYNLDSTAYKEFIKNQEIEEARKILEKYGLK